MRLGPIELSPDDGSLQGQALSELEQAVVLTLASRDPGDAGEIL